MSDEKNKFRGNPHHLSLLTQAVEAGDIAGWNAMMRKSGSSFRPRLAGADLSGMNLGEIRLAGADLTGADLTGTNLSRANLSEARLRSACLRNSNLSGARLIHTDFTGADLSQGNFSGARAHGAVFTEADMTGARLDEADLTRATLRGAAVTGSSRSGGKVKVRVKVRAVPNESAGTGNTGEREDFSPWIKALDDEERLRQLRLVRESRRAETDKAMLDRKLGRKTPLFKRVK